MGGATRLKRQGAGHAQLAFSTHLKTPRCSGFLNTPQTPRCWPRTAGFLYGEMRSSSDTLFPFLDCAGASNHGGPAVWLVAAGHPLRRTGKAKPSYCPLRPRITPFPEEKSIPVVICGVLLWADTNAANPLGGVGPLCNVPVMSLYMNAATTLGAWGRSVPGRHERRTGRCCTLMLYAL